MSANERQVGGEHYASTYQHWDFTIDALGGRYLEGCVTKYATRWRKKNGLQDLEKADHFLQKLRDEFKRGHIQPPVVASTVDTVLLVHKFAEANQLWHAEREVCRVMGQWQTLADLDYAKVQLDRLLRSAREPKRLDAARWAQLGKGEAPELDDAEPTAHYTNQ